MSTDRGSRARRARTTRRRWPRTGGCGPPPGARARDVSRRLLGTVVLAVGAGLVGLGVGLISSISGRTERSRAGYSSATSSSWSFRASWRCGPEGGSDDPRGADWRVGYGPARSTGCRSSPLGITPQHTSATNSPILRSKVRSRGTRTAGGSPRGRWSAGACSGTRASRLRPNRPS